MIRERRHLAGGVAGTRPSPAAEELLHGVLDRHGIEAMTAFIGNPAGHSFGARPLRRPAHGAGQLPDDLLGRHRRPVAQERLVASSCTGTCGRSRPSDIRRTDYWVVMGGNPQASGGSLLALPRRARRDRRHPRARRQGRRRRPPPHRHRRPGRRVDARSVPAPTPRSCWRCARSSSPRGSSTSAPSPTSSTGSTTCAAAVGDFTPERGRRLLPGPGRDHPPHRPRARRRRARRALRAHRPVQPGVRHARLAGSSTWSTSSPGNFDAEGGMMFGKPGGDAAHLGGRHQAHRRARVRPLDEPGAGRARGARPGARARASPRRSPRRARARSRALITIAGNPVISVPDSAQLEAALPGLDCMISIDNYLNETTRFAHVILPGPSPLESPHFDELIWVWAVGSAAKWSDQLFDPPEGDGAASGRSSPASGWYCTGGGDEDFDFDALDDGWFAALCHDARPRPRRGHAARSTTTAGPERMIDLSSAWVPGATATARCPTGSTSRRSRPRPHGIDLGPMVPRARRGRRHAVRADRAGAALHRSATSPGSRDALDRDPDGLRAGQPAPHPLEELLDAQREGAGEGQGPLHPAHPPRRRRRARARRRRPGPGRPARPARSRCPSRSATR